MTCFTEVNEYWRLRKLSNTKLSRVKVFKWFFNSVFITRTFDSQRPLNDWHPLGAMNQLTSPTNLLFRVSSMHAQLFMFPCSLVCVIRTCPLELSSSAILTLDLVARRAAALIWLPASEDTILGLLVFMEWALSASNRLCSEYEAMYSKLHALVWWHTAMRIQHFLGWLARVSCPDLNR